MSRLTRCGRLFLAANVGLRVVDGGDGLAGDFLAFEVADDASVGGRKAWGTTGWYAVVSGQGDFVGLGGCPTSVVDGLDVYLFDSFKSNGDVAAAEGGLDHHWVLGGVFKLEVYRTFVDGGFSSGWVAGDVVAVWGVGSVAHAGEVGGVVEGGGKL